LRISIDIKSIESLIFDYFIEKKINKNLTMIDDNWERIISMKFEEFKVNEKYEKENKFIKTIAKKLSIIYNL
jgi:hypothetical protein